MASPPYNYQSAISPPYPSHAPLPQPSKRRQSDMPSSAPSVKRRKASMLSASSASSHPLRQTSFPPESASNQTARYSRSPSVDTTSLVSGVSSTKKKRGRKAKGKADDDTSVVGEKAKSAVSGTSGRGRRRASREASAEDEDEEGGETAVAMVARTDEEKRKENEHKAMLLNALDPDQFLRYEAWRASKLPDSTVRRIVNQTLSQSAPQSVILAVKSVAKVFIGEMIEGARRVQTQWMESDEEARNVLPSPPADGEEEKRRGPLLPDHLREAYRRHKLAGEGALVGQLGLWQLQQSSGVERFGVKAHGKRLLK
ncbi:hypothetical protein M430DRAFT_97306 [Amorphotheca resinae ATCC 22711]|uniref:TAFII28-like protein domain-containing protein n=1 Tax=Amorphotheca resinae ATCC 22711 TaxID=857342 RepID=A0A2T3B921_AMORE|nr:hypothetical protein M430DRAFT_97306 [Amorphotheca resinae ATCC 22711]PSS23370.1 hypothetical protein M430DRAFT_97306 [Amorphotheca resinae ATCC 22711]